MCQVSVTHRVLLSQEAAMGNVRPIELQLRHAHLLLRSRTGEMVEALGVTGSALLSHLRSNDLTDVDACIVCVLYFFQFLGGTPITS